MSSFDSERSTEGETNTFEIQLESQLVTAVSEVLNKIIDQHRQERGYNRIVRLQKRMPFSSLTKPEINLNDYLIRFISYSKIEEASLIIALIYIDRICQKNNIIITEYNIHRILLISLAISIKYNEDQYYESDYYANIGGITKQELIQLEYKFILLSDFILFVDEKDYEKYKQYLLSTTGSFSNKQNDIEGNKGANINLNEISNIET